MPEPPQLPPIGETPLSVLLPAFNAQPHLDDVLEKWTRHLDKLQRDYEILLIDDGSSDQTAPRVEALAAQNPRLRLLRHEVPTGIGAALRTGLATAQYPLVCCCPCQLSYQPADLKLLLERIDKVHLVTGYRVEQGKRHRPPRRYRWLLRWVFGVHVTDADCAFRLFRREIFARIPIQSKGPFVHAEIIAKANFLGYVIDEVAVSYRPSATERARASGPLFADGWRVFNGPNFGPAQLTPIDPPPEPPAAN